MSDKKKVNIVRITLHNNKSGLEGQDEKTEVFSKIKRKRTKINVKNINTFCIVDAR
jgi:hypothetical protein